VPSPIFLPPPWGLAGDIGLQHNKYDAFPCVLEPFSVLSLDSTGTLVPTILQVNDCARFPCRQCDGHCGTTNITATSIRPNLNMPGWDLIDFTLPASLAGAGDVPIVVSLNPGGFTSRPADTAPHITISP
jgi:hypothetical protein